MFSPQIYPEEELGRQISSRGNTRDPVRKYAFIDRTEDHISVDRMNKASLDEMSEIGKIVANRRRRTFRGWAILLASEAEKDERKLQYDPTQENPYHTHIILPDNTIETKDEHAQLLADASYYQKYP